MTDIFNFYLSLRFLQLQEQGRLSCLSNQTQKDDEITETTGNSIDDVEMKCYHFTDQSDEVIEVPNALVGVTGRVSAYLLEQPVVNKGGKIAVPADMGIIKGALNVCNSCIMYYAILLFTCLFNRVFLKYLAMCRSCTLRALCVGNLLQLYVYVHESMYCHM